MTSHSQIAAKTGPRSRRSAPSDVFRPIFIVAVAAALLFAGQAQAGGIEVIGIKDRPALAGTTQPSTDGGTVGFNPQAEPPAISGGIHFKPGALVSLNPQPEPPAPKVLSGRP